MEGEKAMYTTKTDLINKLASGNETGWQEFENTYRGLIVSVALKHGVSVADTDDIIQVVMLALFNNGKFNYSREKHGKFRTYLGGIIRHKIADHFRKTKSVSPDGFSENEEYALPEFEAVYLAEYRQYILNAAIEDLKQSVSPATKSSSNILLTTILQTFRAMNLKMPFPTIFATRMEIL